MRLANPSSFIDIEAPAGGLHYSKVVVQPGAVRNGASDVCAAATEVIIPLLADDIDLPQTARMDAAYCSVSLAQQKEFATEGSRRALSDALAAASEDDDRYVIAAVRP